MSDEKETGDLFPTCQEVEDLIVELIKKGLIYDSGERRPDARGVQRIVWRHRR
jgi:hypothetical protein